MSRIVRHWAPPNLAESERVRAKLDAVVATWSRMWFPKVALCVTELNSITGPDAVRGRDAPLRMSDRGLSVRGPPRARVRLWEWALDVRLTDHAVKDLDRELIHRFEQKVLDDLLQRLEVELKASPGREGRERYAAHGEVIATVSDTSGGVMTLGLPLELVLPICDSRSVAPPRPAGGLGKLVDALGATSVNMELVLGDAELSLSELSGLEIGDVLILSALVADDAPLQLTTGEDIVARARLTEVGDQLAAVIAV